MGEDVGVARHIMATTAILWLCVCLSGHRKARFCSKIGWYRNGTQFSKQGGICTHFRFISNDLPSTIGKFWWMRSIVWIYFVLNYLSPDLEFKSD